MPSPLRSGSALPPRRRHRRIPILTLIPIAEDETRWLASCQTGCKVNRIEYAGHLIPAFVERNPELFVDVGKHFQQSRVEVAGRVLQDAPHGIGVGFAQFVNPA